MKIKPMQNYKTPSYPDKERVLENPELLKTLPERWKKNAYVFIALSSLLTMTFTSCNGKRSSGSVNGTNAGLTAPIFIHGDGRGSFGCESVAPPAFLSEEEAFTVIAEEAKRQDIEFKKDGATLNKVGIPKTDLNYNPTPESVETEKGDLVLDGIDASKKVAFEFVSQDDIKSWSQNGNGSYSSVESYEFLTTAQALQGGVINKTGDMTVATFYDPHYKYDDKKIQDIINSNKGNWESIEDKLKEQVKEDLRAQVKDFLSWLKSQDII